MTRLTARSTRFTALAAAALLGFVPGYAAAAQRRASGVRTVRAAASSDCTIYAGDPPSTADCGAGGLDTVGIDGNGYAYRTLISFAGAIRLPARSRIISATLNLNVVGTFGRTSTRLFVLLRQFRPRAASWESYDTVHAWSRAGGDFGRRRQASTAVSAAGPASFTVTGLVRGWLSGRWPVRAVMLLSASGRENGYIFSSRHGRRGPVLAITYRRP